MYMEKLNLYDKLGILIFFSHVIKVGLSLKPYNIDFKCEICIVNEISVNIYIIRFEIWICFIQWYVLVLDIFISGMMFWESTFDGFCNNSVCDDRNLKLEKISTSYKLNSLHSFHFVCYIELHWSRLWCILVYLELVFGTFHLNHLCLFCWLIELLTICKEK